MSNLKMFSQSVTDWAIQVLDMLMHLKSKTQTNETAYNCATDILFHIVLNHHFKGGTDTFIGFISFTFLFGVFSNLSSNGLSEWMHKHIYCISLACIHCEFWNDFSICLPDGMHSHTFGTWLTCLHCVFFLQMYEYLQRLH